MFLLPTIELPVGFSQRFDLTQPAGLRLGAALQGTTLSRLLVDDPHTPNWAVLQETCYGTIYLCGKIDASMMQRVIETLRGDSEVLLGLWPGSELENRLLETLAPQAGEQSWVSDFTRRVNTPGFQNSLKAPTGCRLEPLSAAFIDAYLDPGWFQASFGSLEGALLHGFGLALLRGSELLCHAFAGPAFGDLIEVGVETPEPFRGRGYATITCAHLIQACETRGFQTYWNCSQQNLPSIALARKLGYQVEQPYRLLYWSQKL